MFELGACLYESTYSCSREIKLRRCTCLARDDKLVRVTDLRHEIYPVRFKTGLMLFIEVAAATEAGGVYVTVGAAPEAACEPARPVHPPESQ